MGHLYFALGLLILLCTTTEARFGNPVERDFVKVNVICDACLEFSTEAQQVLADPDTQKQAVEFMSELVCQPLTPNLKLKCVDLVTVYVPDALMALQAYVGPEICTETGLCNPQPTNPHLLQDVNDLQSMADAKTCALCEDLAEDALEYLKSDTTKFKLLGALHLACSRLEEIRQQCDLLVDIYAPDLMKHLNNLTPEEFCEMTRLCKPTSGHTHKHAVAVHQIKRNDCAICQFVVLELKLKLKDPATQAKLLDVLLNGCNRVQNHVDECKLIVEQYAPFLLANLDTILDADTLCAKIGACERSHFGDFQPFLSSVIGRHISRELPL